MSIILTSLTNYEIGNLIHESSRTLVYRGQRKSDFQPVIIKLLRSEFPSFNELVQFRHQYTIARNLQIEGIVKPLALERYHNAYALIMEDFGGISLAEYYQNFPPPTSDISQFLDIAIQITEIIEKLHQNRIIHKDIKPANILINPQTKEVKIIDFSISTLLPKETPTIQTPNVLEGTLAYISPEQTGRMNRGIDYRSDFYSLGVTFFEMLNGKLPFESSDPMELVHCHLAKMPNFKNREQGTGNREQGRREEGREIPQMLIDIVMKLMAKNAEDRYQSALGLKYDLEKCWYQWHKDGKIKYFELGSRDISDRFLIPEKLYGREGEIEQLLAAFERVVGNTTELMLVAGFSGIGKTAVVNEVHKPIVREKGYFIKGKFDQFNRNIPFSALVQSLRDLIAQILSESDTQLQQWKNQILEAVGENGQVIIEVIPELEKIIGKQPAVPELSGSAAQNRFNLLFGKFIQVFTTKEHPLVIFLDDLQWADSASLNLMKLLVSQVSNSYLLMLGAYRDNEVFAAHPLMLTLDEMKKAEARINTITLTSLSEDNINRLVADTLSCDQEVAQPLTELVYQKTKGNPFFTTQFLLGLYEDELIKFNFEVGYWECDITEVKQRALTDDVVEFMAQRLQKLPGETQEVLKLAACIGNIFDLETLAIVSQESPVETASDLWNGLQMGLILPQSDIYKFFIGVDKQIENPENSENVAYKFLHDRIQQAAYGLIAEDQKQKIHYHIGQLLLEQSSIKEQEERLFEIVNHLNIGIALISQIQERENLAQLNLKAGQKAKTATAYSAAIEFLTVGIQLLGVNCWQDYYDLSLELHSEIAEASYLNTNFEQMEQWANVVLQQSKTLLDTIQVQHTRIMGAKAKGQIIDSIEIGLQLLKELGIEFPQQPTQEDVETAYKVSRTLWTDKPPQSLVNLPIMSEPNLLAAMNVLTALTPAAFITSPNLMLLLIFKEIELSILSGNTPISIIAYNEYALVLCGIMDDISNGYEFGELALSLLEKFSAKSFKSRCLYVVSTHVKHWKNALSDILTTLEVAYEASLETGDLETLGWNIAIYCGYSYHQGQNLAQLAEKMETYRQTMIQYKLAFCLPFQEIYQQTVLNLLGKAKIPYSLIGKIFNQEKSLPQLQATNQRTALFFFFLNQSILNYIFGKNHQAIQTSAQTAEYLDGGIGMFMVVLHFYFDALIQLAQYSQITLPERQSILLKVQQNQEKLHHWATLSPINHQHRWELVEAERCRVLGNKNDAMEAYDKAIAGAKENEYIQDEAIANELAAKFYLNWGIKKVAAVYMQEAYYCYARWGAKAKTDDLEQRYRDLLSPILKQTTQILDPLEIISTLTQHSVTATYSSTVSINKTLDFATILKASQAISGIIELDELLRQLTQIILLHSGGDRCVLILPNSEGKWSVKAIATLQETEICCQPLENHPNVPTKLIQYVKNTQETVIVNDLKTDLPVIGKYLLQNQPKSVLCLPILNQGNLIGILCLKNLLVSGAFTTERVLILNFLCTQAAIALENARLYKQSQTYAQKLEQSQLQIVQYEKMASLGNLMAGVAHEINNPLGFINGSISILQENLQDMMEHLQLYQKHYPDTVKAIEENAEEIDLDYLYEDIPKLLNSMENATERIKNLSTSLRNFSRADREHKVKADIHQQLDSTLMILKYRLKANQQRPGIQVIKDYGDFSEVQSFPGQLNQVFMNIIANAIDVFDEAAQDLSNSDFEAQLQKITIKTALLREKNVVEIMIEDNGKGMTPEVKERIFDHLFTTKEVGKGTGLGLAIVRQIVVEKHGGAIDCISELGKGTKFIITLPLQRFSYE